MGKRSLQRPDIVAPNRKQLVGLLTEGGTRLEEGAQIVLDPNQSLPMTMAGHVTSSYDSVALGRPIAMAGHHGRPCDDGQERCISRCPTARSAPRSPRPTSMILTANG